MGFSLYCFNPKNENDLIKNSDINVNSNDLEQKEIESKNVNTTSNINNKSTIVSPVNKQKDIFINPIPEIVTLIPRRKILSNNSINLYKNQK